MARATSYDEAFYDAIRSGCRSSAAAVVPVVLDRIGPVASVVDVGCGEGWWGQTFADAGAHVIGLDSGTRAESAPSVELQHADLTAPLPKITADLAICLEVAEHLPASRAASFVADLTAIAPTVLFSAAMPRQGGTGHINCQPPAYWADLFAGHGFGCDGTLRWDIWNDPTVEPWYRSNLLIFTAGTETDPPLHVIHPDLYLAGR